MASRAKVVLNLVGPYTLYGRPVIEACVAAGAHYADLTGEIPFVRQMIDEFDERADEAGVKIVAGQRLRGAAARPRGGARRRDRARALGRGAGGRRPRGQRPAAAGVPRPADLLSGGTLQSLAAIAGTSTPRPMTDPAALITDPGRAARGARAQPDLDRAAARDGTVIAPMAPAAFINPAVIQRTAALNAGRSRRGAVPLPRGMALGGTAATLPLRYAAAGAIAERRPRLAAADRARPRCAQRIAARTAQAPAVLRVRPLGRPASSSGGGTCPSRAPSSGGNESASRSTPTANPAT